MRFSVEERVLNVGKYISETNSTVRETATEFNVSKSTVHKDCVERLPYIDKNLYGEVRKILDFHKEIRAIRGGEATRNKYLRLKRTV